MQKLNPAFTPPDSAIRFLLCWAAQPCMLPRMSLPVLNIDQMRGWEKATWASGQTEEAVIRRVGQEVARWALQLTAPGQLILILAGKGNNGADARCARDHLPERRVDVLELKDPAGDLSKLKEALLL